MEEALKSLPRTADPRLLLGHQHADDAGIVALTDEIALVQTVDFFTPVVDEPRDFGRIAAANAMSDVFAMGGRAISALNIVCFPDHILEPGVLGEILAGGHDVIVEAGAVLAGGHSVSDKELKYGLAVTGVVHPERFWHNASARPGDQFVLTKGLGTGLLSTALKKGKLSDEHAAFLIQTMGTLNAAAAAAARGLDDERPGAIGAVTDVTGYGLVGHSAEIARASKVHIVLSASSLPELPGALEASRKGFHTRGEEPNATYAALTTAQGIDPHVRSLALDPQTSGGLLIGVRESDASELCKRLVDAGAGATIVGAVHSGPAAVTLAN